MPKSEHRLPIGKNRVTIIPRIHGKITKDGKASEPDIQRIMEKWLERHPEFKERTKFRFRTFRGVF